jgi:spermidine synthase
MARCPVLLAVLVAISGAASLIYELLWIRALGLHFGTTTPAIATVVATFMAGIGLGNLFFGAWADRSARPFGLYRRLELTIAITGLGVSLLFVRAGTWLDALARSCAGAGAGSTAAMAGVLSLFMLVPTTAMGGTLPVLTRALAGRQQPGRALGVLYACNTLGAIAGALVPDFLSIPQRGLTFTACVAAAANLTVALVVGRFVRTESQPLTAAPRLAAPTGLDPVQLGALAISACSGFCALGLEVLWSRTLQHWAAALVTSFAVLLAVYLTALAGGALLAQRYADRSRTPLRTAALLLGLTAVTALGPIAAAPVWRDLERSCWPRPLGLRRLGLLHEAIDALLHSAYLEAAPCLLMGAMFPFVAAAWLARGRPGVRTGQLFLVNTWGGVLGALFVGFLGLPRLGEQASYCLLSLLLAGVAACCAWTSEQAGSGRSARTLTLTLLAGVLALSVGLPKQHLLHAHFRRGGELIEVQEGPTTTAAAAAHFVYGEPYYRELLTPGISMSSTRADARRYMAMMAHAALLTAGGSKRALLICYGVGNTASALLSDRALARLDVVDISPEVLALASHFAAARGDDPLGDPRIHVFIDDGRHHLITSRARYDIITAEGPPPNHAGVANLYSREFYRLAKQRLAADGVMTQWLPVFQLADSDVRAMIAAFVAELPYTALLYGYQQQLILIGGLRPLALDPSRLRRLDDPELSKNLRANYIGGVEDVLGSVLQTDAELRREVAGVAALSDEQPSIQYPYQALRDRDLYSSRFAANPRRALSLLGPEANPALQARVVAAAAAIARALAALPVLDRQPPEARELLLGRLLQPALVARPDDEGLWDLLAVDRDRVALAQRALARPGAAALLDSPRRLIEASSAESKYLVLHDALWLLLRRAFYARDCANAQLFAKKLRPEANEVATQALFTAGCLRARGEYAASAAAFRAAAAASGDRAFQEASRALADGAAEPFTPSAGAWSVAISP